MAAPASAGDTDTPVESGFPPFETEWFASQLFWLAICFGFLYLLLSRFILPRLSGVIEQRQDRIAKDLDEAERIQAQAAQSASERAQKLREAHIAARDMIAKTKAQAETEAASHNNAMIAGLDKAVMAAQAKMDEQQQAALQTLDKTVQEAASAMIGKLSGTAPDSRDVQMASSQALKELVH